MRVNEDRAHALLVYDGDDCVGWCEFGEPDELPRIKSRRSYLDDLDELPDWRITCFVAARDLRGHGVAAAGLAGALQQIATLGGGLVGGRPRTPSRRSGLVPAQRHPGDVRGAGFERTRRIGKSRWVVRKVVG